MKARYALKSITMALLIIILICASPPGSAAKKTVIKIATLAPEGSPWMQTFKAVATELKAKTAKQVNLRIYPGGVLGDEKDMLRKMYINQIQGAVLTSAGLSSIFPAIDVFQIPFLFEQHAEVDYVLSRMDGFFRRGFETQGYNLLGWSEGGFVRLLSTIPVDTLEKLKKAKVWTWEDAPMSKAIFDEAGVSAIPLSIPDVLVGLQTGLVEVVYAPPSGAIALQWFTKTKYMTDVPLIYLVGAVVIRQKIFKKISPPNQEILHQAFKRHMLQLKEMVRQQNQEAIRVMSKHGVKILKPPKDQVEAFKRLSEKAIAKMRNVGFSQEVQNTLKTHLHTYRSTPK